MSKPDLIQVVDTEKSPAEIGITLMRASLECMQRLTELNMTATRELLNTTAATAEALLSTDMNQVAKLNQELAKSDRMMEYWRSFYELCAQMQQDITGAIEGQYQQLGKTAVSAVDQSKSLAPAPGGVFVDAMNSMLEQTHKAFDQMNVVAGQMAGIANVQAKPSEDSRRSDQSAA